MEILIKKLGAIRTTSITVKPLTIIIGKNNTSKTWLSYSIYGIHRLFGESPWHFGQDTPYSALADPSAQPLRLETKQVDAMLGLRLKHLREAFKSELTEYFQDTSKTAFKGADFEIRVSPERRSQAIFHALKVHEAKLEPGENAFTIAPLRMFDTQSEGDRVAFHIHVIAQTAARSLFPRPFILPAERNALVITYKLLSSRRLRMMRDQRRAHLSRLPERQLELMREQGELRYPRPVEDFLDFLTDIETLYSKTRGKSTQSFHTLANTIEASIQGGNRTSVQQTPLGGHEVRVEVPTGGTLDLYNASSSIKQLAPLLLYLRYSAQRGDMLMIDEPEMNLHPESQACLLEALAILVNLGVSVFLTTHSPTLLAHLSTMTAASKYAARRKRQAAHLYLGDPRAFLNVCDVSAYELKDGNLFDLIDPDETIRWDTLSDVSVDIQAKYFAVREAK